MTERVPLAGLQVVTELAQFVEREALVDTDLGASDFWAGFAQLVADLTPRNRTLLAERDRIQSAIDEWHAQRPGERRDYRALLTAIGYLLPEPDDFTITTAGVDPEIASTAGPQLVVPVLNARYALNAANARWGSLYDALYGTDAISESDGATRGANYNPVRGAQVIAYGRRLLDDVAPLASGSHADAIGYAVDESGLQVTLPDAVQPLADPGRFAGYTGDRGRPDAVVLVHHGLHVELLFDRTGAIGSTDAAGIQDIALESAITTIVDFEDSVAAVDAADKVLGYRNWLQLNTGELSAEVSKGRSSFTRRLDPDRTYRTADGGQLVLAGRALLFVRNVGHHMTTSAVLDADGNEVFEGLLDAAVTTLGALPGVRGATNSRTGSIYIVKPKMHGPDEVAFTVDLFGRVEQLLGLDPNTIKIGLMDEERRTSVNLKAAIHAARERIAFINTGFLDRSGDEIHTCLDAGPVVRKEDMKSQEWISAYEKQNVEIGLAAGFRGHGQIGKGMWAMPDLMADMLTQKIAQPKAGASTAWVPSPTAATLHALHYHAVDVGDVQLRMEQAMPPGSHRDLDALLKLPIADSEKWSEQDRARQVDTNTQSILGYVVRWVDDGVGCSKVPDIDDVALMEDRATLRISSQLMANWLRHGVVDAEQVRESLLRMAAVVDEQNAADPGYRPMAADPDSSVAFRAAGELIFDGAVQPNGYTEAILTRNRIAAKQARQ